MAGVLKGEIRRCDFGCQRGSELAQKRCALVVSANSFHDETSLAIVVPTTTKAPRRAHEWHTYIADAATWASLRQIKTVQARQMQSRVGSATDAELNHALAAIAKLMPPAADNPGAGDLSGSIWTVDIPSPPGAGEPMALVLYYNSGNRMAIVAMLGVEGRPPSRVAIPVDGGIIVGQRVVLAHQVRSLYVPERLGELRGVISPADMETVGAAFLDIIA